MFYRTYESFNLIKRNIIDYWCIAHIRKQCHLSKDGKFELWWLISYFLVHLVVKTTYFYMQNWPLEGSVCHYCMILNTNVSISKSSVLLHSIFLVVHVTVYALFSHIHNILFLKNLNLLPHTWMSIIGYIKHLIISQVFKLVWRLSVFCPPSSPPP